jgi:hypothetical protein
MMQIANSKAIYLADRAINMRVFVEIEVRVGIE